MAKIIQFVRKFYDMVARCDCRWNQYFCRFHSNKYFCSILTLTSSWILDTTARRCLQFECPAKTTTNLFSCFYAFFKIEQIKWEEMKAVSKSWNIFWKKNKLLHKTWLPLYDIVFWTFSLEITLAVSRC